ncbi:HEAT repeat domain-containing protein [Candidatus Bipolaricaulota bacterium]
MRKTHSTIVTVSLLAAAVVAASGFVAQEDPSYWIETMRQGGGDVRKEARTQLIAMGSAAIPVLIEATHDEEDYIRWEAVNALGSLADDYPEEVRPSVPALTERVVTDRDSHVRWRSLWALSVFPGDAVQEQAIPQIRAGLEDDNPTLVWNAVVGLAYFAQPDAAPHLNQGVIENEGFARWEAVYCLHMVHNEESVLLLAELIVAVETMERSLRQEAAMTLGRIGDSSAIPALIQALNDPEMHVRWRVAAALAKLEAVEAIEAIETALEREEDEFAIEQMLHALELLTEETSDR